MHSHPLARLTPISRERLIRLHIDQGVPLLDLAAQGGISLRTVYKWLARFRDGGLAALVDQRGGRGLHACPHLYVPQRPGPEAES